MNTIRKYLRTPIAVAPDGTIVIQRALPFLDIYRRSLIENSLVRRLAEVAKHLKHHIQLLAIHQGVVVPPCEVVIIPPENQKPTDRDSGRRLPWYQCVPITLFMFRWNSWRSRQTFSSPGRTSLKPSASERVSEAKRKTWFVRYLWTSVWQTCPICPHCCDSKTPACRRVLSFQRLLPNRYCIPGLSC